MSTYLRAIVLAVAATTAACRGATDGAPWRTASEMDGPAVLRVCADPNNLPASNERLEGLENHLAALVARDRGMRVRFVWWAQRRGFLRNTLDAGVCDVVMGYPTHSAGVLTTRPYYRSMYVAVTRHGEAPISSLDDPRLRTLRVGVALVGNEGASTPPAEALGRRGIAQNVRGYSIFGTYTDDSPPARLVEAVARAEIDVALAWGPLAGFVASRQTIPLDVTPLRVSPGQETLPFSFDISMAVRRGDVTTRDWLDTFITRHGELISRLLDEFHVPRPREGAAS